MTSNELKFWSKLAQDTLREYRRRAAWDKQFEKATGRLKRKSIIGDAKKFKAALKPKRKVSRAFIQAARKNIKLATAARLAKIRNGS